MTMHQCDYCCWYVSMARGCECPWVMREKACKNAQQKALAALPKKKISEKIADEHDNTAVVRREESKHQKEIICTKCGKKYKSKTSTEYNNVGMWMEYAYCPECSAKNLIAWHVW